MLRRKRSRLVLPIKEYKLLAINVLQRDNYRCQVPYCGARQNLHAHHIKFRSHGGDDASYNLITLCNDCHDALHSRYVVIHPLKEDEDVDADKGVRWQFLEDWLPKSRTRRKR